MILNGRIVIGCDAEHLGSFYYYNEEDGNWYGHWKSSFLVVKRGQPTSEIMKKILTKLAVKQGYPREIFKFTPKVDTPMFTQTQKKSAPKKKSVAKPKPKNSTFVSLF